MNSLKVTRRGFVAGAAVLAGGCAAGGGSDSDDIATSESESFSVESFDDRLAAIIAPDAVAEVVESGFEWTEGPTWDQKRGVLYFSDIPNNRVHSWDAEDGLGLWRAEAGSVPAPEGVSPGTNGLLYLPEEDALLVCDQSSRSVIKYDLANGGDPVPVARGPEDMPFNSPNDVVRDSDGGIYFTDPPYGLAEGPDSPLQARGHNGVYYLAAGESEAVLIDGDNNFPNGIGLSPDGQTLYVAVSDKDAPRIMRYARDGETWVRDAEPWFDMTPLKEGDMPGSADGMAIAQDGTIFATAPGGMIVLTPEAEMLGRLVTGNATGNCGFGDDGNTIFITSDGILVRLPVLVTGLGFPA